MNVFAELGAVVESRWRELNYEQAVFPSIAAQAIAEANIPAVLDPWEIIRWVHDSDVLPEQMDLEGGFGNPPITLYVAPRFYIDVYYWLDGTTSIHQHGFSGAFQVLLGSSVHAQYGFEKHREINPHLLIGRVSLKDVALLERGDIRQIIPGPDFIHSLFHLDRPSVTIIVRSFKAPHSGPQYSYLKPFVARDPFYTNPSLRRKVQTVELLLRMKHPEADQFINSLLDSSDFQTTFSVLQSAFDFLCHRELEEMFGVSRSTDRFQKLLERARARHGELTDLLLPVFEEEWLQRDISRRRSEIKQEDHRFFLALLMNVPDRKNLLKLLSQRFPNDDPIKLIVTWTKELAATRTFGAREPNVLGVTEFNDYHLLVFEKLLRGLSTEEICKTAEANQSQVSIKDLVAHVQAVPIFKSLFTN